MEGRGGSQCAEAWTMERGWSKGSFAVSDKSLVLFCLREREKLFEGDPGPGPSVACLLWNSSDVCLAACPREEQGAERPELDAVWRDWQCHRFCLADRMSLCLPSLHHHRHRHPLTACIEIYVEESYTSSHHSSRQVGVRSIQEEPMFPPATSSCIRPDIRRDPKTRRQHNHHPPRPA